MTATPISWRHLTQLTLPLNSNLIHITSSNHHSQSKTILHHENATANQITPFNNQLVLLGPFNKPYVYLCSVHLDIISGLCMSSFSLAPRRGAALYQGYLHSVPWTITKRMHYDQVMSWGCQCFFVHVVSWASCWKGEGVCMGNKYYKVEITSSI